MQFAKPCLLSGALLLAATLLAGPLAHAQASSTPAAVPASAQGGSSAQDRSGSQGTRGISTERTLVSGGIKREYILRLPKDAPPGPRPLVIALHGALQPAGVMQRYLDLDAVADREGFVVAYPRGLNLLWNDGRSSVAGFIPILRKRDDARFVLDLLERLEAEGIADPSRAYLMGFSNGGFLTAFVACRYADRFAAYATLMMTVPVGYAETCQPSKPVPILMMNGTYDPIVPMFGRPTPGARLMSASESAALFARLDGCEAPEESTAPHARIVRWNRCSPGSAVAFYEIAGGHQPPAQSTDAADALASLLLGPRRSGLDAPEEIWSFFKRFGGEVPAIAAAAPAPAAAAPANPASASTAGAPILRDPNSLDTAWQGIVPGRAPGHTVMSASPAPLAQTNIPPLHQPLALGAPMPLSSSFVPAEVQVSSFPSGLTSGPVPVPAPSPLRQQTAVVTR